MFARPFSDTLNSRAGHRFWFPSGELFRQAGDVRFERGRLIEPLEGIVDERLALEPFLADRDDTDDAIAHCPRRGASLPARPGLTTFVSCAHTGLTPPTTKLPAIADAATDFFTNSRRFIVLSSAAPLNFAALGA
jgi:hypothetical protein